MTTPPRHRQARHITSLALLVAACIAIAEPASAENENICTELPEVQRGPCQEAFDLLTQEQDLPQSDLTVLVRGIGQAWRYEYKMAEGAATSYGEVTCVLEGALTLPRGRPVQLLFTADDDIYEWDLTVLGIKATAIPGRISEIYVEALVAGTFTGSSVSGSEELTPRIEVLDSGSFDTWREDTLLKSCDGT